MKTSAVKVAGTMLALTMATGCDMQSEITAPPLQSEMPRIATSGTSEAQLLTQPSVSVVPGSRVPVRVLFLDAEGVPMAGRGVVAVTLGSADQDVRVKGGVTDTDGVADIRWTVPMDPGTYELEVSAPMYVGESVRVTAVVRTPRDRVRD